MIGGLVLLNNTQQQKAVYDNTTVGLTMLTNIKGYNIPFITTNRTTVSSSTFYEFGVNGATLLTATSSSTSISYFDSYTVGNYLGSTIGSGDSWCGAIAEMIVFDKIIMIYE